MGGYNSVAEAVYFGKRPVVVPRQPGPEEQVLRAEGFAHLGLAKVIKPELLAPDALWAAIDASLSDGAPPALSLPFDGLSRIATALATLPD
jgi:predicted glycosyltransferase